MTGLVSELICAPPMQHNMPCVWSLACPVCCAHQDLAPSRPICLELPNPFERQYTPPSCGCVLCAADLYHLDHFLGGFKTACGPLVDCQAFTLLQGPPDSPSKPLEPLPAGAEAVYVAVTDSKGADGGVFELRLVQREAGLKAGCWMTKSCLRVK